MTETSIRRASLEALRHKKNNGELLDSSLAPVGEELGPEFWAKARLEAPQALRSVHLKIDQDVFEFFKSGGKGHLTRMQEVLRAYVKAHSNR